MAASEHEAAVPAVAAAVAELYGADPDVFTERRKALAAAAKEAGDREAASAIGALRKPTRAAWVVNQLARAEPSAADRMAALAAELRAAEAAKDGPRLRELSAARGALIDALTDQALAAAGTPDPPPSLRAEVTDTLTAALADPATAADFAAGRLTKAAQWGGFGYAGFGVADGSAADTPVSGRPPPGPGAAPIPASQAGRSGQAGQAERPGQAVPTRPPLPSTDKRQAREQRERELTGTARARAAGSKKSSGGRRRRPSAPPAPRRNSRMPNGPWLRPPPPPPRPWRRRTGWRRRSANSKTASPRRGKNWPPPGSAPAAPKRPSAVPARPGTGFYDDLCPN